MAITDVVERAAAYGMPGSIVDGMDAVAIYEAATEALERARRGEGPTFLECKTYRYYNHHGVQTLGAKYRSDEEVESARQRDPIDRHEKLLIDGGVMTAEGLQAVREQIQEEVDDAVQFGENSPMPDPSTLLDDVYSLPKGEIL
jgi:TPP-dependent pyruvate/acetoin dehydrogenase alpha subunit